MTGPMAGVLLAIALLGAAGAGKKEAAPVQAAPGRARQITLDPRAPGAVVEIHLAPGVLTTVELPEEIQKVPTCADCSDPSSPGDALYVLQGGLGYRYLTLWPNLLTRRWSTMVSEELLIPVVVELGHAKLTLVAKRVEPRVADRRVVVLAPNHSVEDEYLRVERQKLMSEVTGQIDAGVASRFEEAFKVPHRCEKKRDRARHDDIVLVVREICSFGQLAVIVFTVENRARPPVESAKVVVKRERDAKPYALNPRIEFDEETTGVAVMKLSDGVDPRGPYDVTLYEGKGKERVVAISGVNM